MTLVKNPDGTYTIQFTAEEAAVMNEVETIHGMSVFNELIDQWLKTHREAFADIARRAFEQKFDSLTSAKQQQVRDLLEDKA